MLEALGRKSLESMIDDGTPSSIRLIEPLELPAAQSEIEAPCYDAHGEFQTFSGPDTK